MNETVACLLKSMKNQAIYYRKSHSIGAKKKRDKGGAERIGELPPEEAGSDRYGPQIT